MAESRKIGRGKRSPSAKAQPHRTKANKSRNVEMAKKRITKELAVPHGTARKARRASVNWAKVNESRQTHGKSHTRWQDYVTI